MTRLARWTAATALALAAAQLGCERATEPPPPSAEVAEHLQALGYVDWDDAAAAELGGVTLLDRERASAGYNLYVRGREIYLMDLEGRHAHTWSVADSVLPGSDRKCSHAQLLEDDRLLVLCAGRAILLLDRDSNLVADIRGPVHHDVGELEDGRLLILHAQEHRRYRGRRVNFDGLSLIAVDDGKLKPVWSSFLHRRELSAYHAPTDLDVPPQEGEKLKSSGYDYYHVNSVQVLPDTELGRRDPRFRKGNWLVCLRNVDLMVVLDAQDRSVTWSWGPGELELPHMPRMLDTGRILVFDNGSHRRYSRVLEIDPETEQIVWQYQGDPPDSFFSKWRGGAQRLPNGNTLITETDKGRAFEVTPSGELVWEFWNPVIQDGKRARIYRLVRLSPERVGRILAR